jgi:cysteine synthase A
MPILPCVTSTIGQSPLVRLNRVVAGINCEIYLKLEAQLPGGSIKDRVGLRLVEVAEASGVITPHQTTLIEPTSGNSGIALAMVAAVKGYKLIIVMPESCSMERRVILQAYGATVVLTPACGGMKAACDKAHQLAEAIPDAYFLDQFNNPANTAVHFDTTGPEIWTDTEGQLDALVASVGTGGTLTGAGGYLKQQQPAVQVIAVEPAESPVLAGGTAGVHLIQGIGTGFIPSILDTGLIDEVMGVSSEDALVMARRLAKEEGLLSGISTGANVVAALRYGQRPENAGKRIVTFQCSTGERYLSSALFAPLWDACSTLVVELP